MKFNISSLGIVYRKFIHKYFRIYRERDYYKDLASKYEKFNPPGHYYSPIPNEKDIPDSIIIDYDISIPGIDLKPESQLALLEELKQYYNKSIFSSEKVEDARYYFDNDYFGYSDGIFLAQLLQLFSPKKIIEIGSGFSSALMLDVNEKFLNNSIDLTFIEPYPEERLNILTHSNDKCSIIKDFVQNVDNEIWHGLKENDILFIDSSHVLKFGSDVESLFLKVIPLLNKGVIVHIHDVFFPFEYPVEWLKQGRAWNESYFLRAFLQFNSDFEILLFTSFLEGKYRKWFEINMPLCLKKHKKILLGSEEILLSTTGQSIYIRRK
jgi:predicted O-methyltransferase YrrM